MKLTPLAQLKLIAVLATAYALPGCESPSTNAVVQAPPVYPVAAATPMPDLVTVSTAAPQLTPVPTPAPAPAPGPGPVPNPAATPERTSNEPARDEPGRGPVVLSDRLQEVVKLAQSGVGDDVILAFIQNSPTAFNPTPDEIVYLTDLGISDVVITALVNHRNPQPEMAAQPAPTAPPAPSAEAPPQEVAVPAQATYNPEPPIVYTPQPVVQYVAPAPAIEYDYFYSALTPYGSWIEVADYGWCWQPTVAVIQADWRPYCHRGRWLYTDCGWYWHSDYSWGWAPFHYGRWFHHPRRGWCWRPDSVWAPAWVSWRYTDTYCGWAPLPPGAHYHSGVGFTYYGASVGVSFSFGLHHDAWTFVPANRFHDREVWRHRVRAAEHRNVFQRSRVANHYQSRDHVIINRGVNDYVPALNRTEPRRVLVRDIPEKAGTRMRPDQIQQEGKELVVYRPKPPVAGQTAFRAAEPAGARAVASQRPPAERTATRLAPSPGAGGREGSPGSSTISPNQWVARPQPATAGADRSGSGAPAEVRPVQSRSSTTTSQPSVSPARPPSAPGTAVRSETVAPAEVRPVQSRPSATTSQPSVSPARPPSAPGTAVRSETVAPAEVR
ncbi:MAG: DUF6600 domain-containing protein, partial [Bryobacteraceae bacterium]